MILTGVDTTSFQHRYTNFVQKKLVESKSSHILK